MKTNLAIIAFSVLLGVNASAVSLSWSGAGASAKLYGLEDGKAMTTGNPSETSSITMYYFLASDYDTIVNLGAVDAADLASYVVASAAGQTSSNTSASGRVGKSNTTTAFTESGVSFFARAYATFNGDTYFIDLFGGSGADGKWVTTKSGDQTILESLTWANGTYGGATSTVVGTKNAWVAVPEPATGALALAGVALLFRRRKA